MHFRYDIPSGDLLHGAEDDIGTLESVAYLHSLISEVTEGGVSADRVVLCGFSQGGTMSVVAGLTCEKKLAGVGCMSGRAVMREGLKSVSGYISMKSAGY
jgi:predicted esterase